MIASTSATERSLSGAAVRDGPQRDSPRRRDRRRCTRAACRRRSVRITQSITDPPLAARAQAVPEILRRRDHQRRLVIVVEGTETKKIRAVRLEDDAAASHQRGEIDVTLEAVDLFVRDARHALLLTGERDDEAAALLNDCDARPDVEAELFESAAADADHRQL